MKTYYFVDKDKKRQGPFTMEDLMKCAIGPNTFIWTSGLSNWIKVKDFEEVNSFLFGLHGSDERKEQDFGNLKRTKAALSNIIFSLQQRFKFGDY